MQTFSKYIRKKKTLEKHILDVSKDIFLNSRKSNGISEVLSIQMVSTPKRDTW